MRPIQRIVRLSLVSAAVMWLIVAGLVAIVVRLRVPTPAELLADVAERPATWIAANVLLILLPLTFAIIGPYLARIVGVGEPATGLVTGLLSIAGGAMVASGVFHGVFGAHLASHVVGGRAPDVELVRLAEVVHALGDTTWFVGVGGLTAATALVTALTWRSAERVVTAVAVSSVVGNLLQFGWFADHVFGVFAAPGTLFQAAWFFVLAIRGGRAHPA